MELKNRIWMNGNLEWFAYLADGDEVFLGRREVPIPLAEGDEWTNDLQRPVVEHHPRIGRLVRTGSNAPPRDYWLEGDR